VGEGESREPRDSSWDFIQLSLGTIIAERLIALFESWIYGILFCLFSFWVFDYDLVKFYLAPFFTYIKELMRIYMYVCAFMNIHAMRFYIIYYV
jgi:hypothetical protein